MPQVYLLNKSGEGVSFEGIKEVLVPTDSSQQTFAPYYSEELLNDSVKETYTDNGTYTLTPSEGLVGFKQATVNVLCPEPVITVSDTGLITATSGKQESKRQLVVEEGEIITPSLSSQIAIKQGTYATGDIVVAPIPDDYVSRTSQFNTWGRAGAAFISPSYDKITIYTRLNIDSYNETVMANQTDNISYNEYLGILARAENSVIPDLLNNLGKLILAEKDFLNNIIINYGVYFCGVKVPQDVQFSALQDEETAWKQVIDTLQNAVVLSDIDKSNYFTRFSDSTANTLQDISYFRCRFPFTLENGEIVCEFEYNISNVNVDGTTYNISSADNLEQEDSTITLKGDE